jgi:ubiquinone/menaquinone biosynthesis C-methylase UbiE
MTLYDLLDSPAVYKLKTKLLSLGRASVREYLARRIRVASGDVVLDVACGPGRHVDAFPCLVAGVDRTPAYLRYAARQSRNAFFAMDATALAFPDGNFDFVFAVGLFHHIADDQVRAAAREMKRVTKPGGQALIIDAVLPSRSNVLGYLLFRLDRGLHTRSLDALAALLNPEGFVVETRNIPASFPYQRAAFAWKRRA